jgi:hypothetical protein
MTTTTFDRCEYCGRPFDGPHPEDLTICRECWYSGRWAAENLRPLTWALGEITGTPWFLYHTGGGCFAVVTTAAENADGDPAPLSGPCIVITADGDVLRGDHTLEEVEGWDLGVYLHGFDGDPDEFAEDLPFESLVCWCRDYRAILTPEGPGS